MQNVRQFAEIIRGTMLDVFSGLRNEYDWSTLTNKQTCSHIRESGGGGVNRFVPDLWNWNKKPSSEVIF